MRSLRTLLLPLLALSMACTSRRCAGLRPLNATIAERSGPGFRAKVTCVVSTRVVIDRSTQPLMRGCRASTTFEVDAFSIRREEPLFEASSNFDDCRDAERSCRSVRAEIVERSTPSGTIVGAHAHGGRIHKYFIVARAEPIAYEREHEGQTIDQLPEPATVAMQFARSGALSDREGNGHENIVALFSAAFVQSYGDELQSLAQRCALRAPFVEALVRARPSAFDPIFRAQYGEAPSDAVTPMCAGRPGGLQRADAARFRRAAVDELANPSPTSLPLQRSDLLVYVSRERVTEATPSVRREANTPSGAYTAHAEDARRWSNALCALVAIDRDHAHEIMLPLFSRQPAEGHRLREIEPCVNGVASTRWNVPVEALANALDSLRTPATLAGLERVVADRSAAESTRTLARTLLDRAAPRALDAGTTAPRAR